MMRKCSVSLFNNVVEVCDPPELAMERQYFLIKDEGLEQFLADWHAGG